MIDERGFALATSVNPAERLRALQRELEEAQAELAAAEAELAREQAAVNRFRMHCRLKIGRWVDDIVDLRTERQALLTRLQLLRQADELGVPYDEDDPFWQSEAENVEAAEPDDELLLPTEVPRDRAAEKRLYRQLARRFHPDTAATSVEKAYATTMMVAVNNAYANDDIDTLRDLADELDPDVVDRLAQIETPSMRKLQQRVLTLRRRRRKVRARQRALWQDNTAQLYRKAQRLETRTDPWWEAVRLELERAIERTRGEIGRLEGDIAVLERK